MFRRRRSEPAPAPEVDKSDAEWREQLTPQQYRVLRLGATDRAFSGPTGQRFCINDSALRVDDAH